MTGGCTCGELRYELASAPLIVHCCHCTACQRETGSAFIVNAMIESERVVLQRGDPDIVDTPTESGRGQRIARCPTCRIAVWSTFGRGADLIRFVRVGTLDEAHAVPPDVHIFVRSKVPWLPLPDGARAFDVFYDRETEWSAASLARRRAVLDKAKEG